MIGAVRDLLETNKTALGLKLVAGAASLAALGERPPPAAPAAYVMLESAQAEPNELACGGISQRVAARLLVALAVRQVADARGEAGGDEVEALAVAVRDLLLGFAPEAGADPLELAGSQHLAFAEGHVWHGLVFTGAYYVRKTS